LNSAKEACQENTKNEPIAYDPECPFRYNNFVYRISLPSPLDKENGACQSQPARASLAVLLFPPAAVN